MIATQTVRTRVLAALSAAIFAIALALVVPALALADDGGALQAGAIRSDALEAASGSEGSPLYRLFQPANGEHHYTLSAEERDICTSQWGWVYEGEAWDCPAESPIPVYRLFNRSTGLHHYTISEDEREICIDRWGWEYEGVAWYSYGDSGVPVYRLFHPVTGLHHYTTSADERDICTGKWGWTYEGVAWHGAPDGSDPGYSDEGYLPVYHVTNLATRDDTYTASKDERNSALSATLVKYRGASWLAAPAGDPVHRLFNSSANQHMLTASDSELSALVSAGWADEGVVFYSPNSDAAGSVPIYRLLDSAHGSHQFTPNVYERDRLVSEGWTNEGVAFYGHIIGATYSEDLSIWTPHISGDYDFDCTIETLINTYSTLWSAFNYVVGFGYSEGNRFWSGGPYLDNDTTIAYAKEMLANGAGNCYRFASLFSWMARGLGYSTNVLSGYVPMRGGGSAPHGWVEVYSGGTYVCDPDAAHEGFASTTYMFQYGDSGSTQYGLWV